MHTDGGGPGVPGIALAVKAVVSFPFLLWKVLRAPPRTARVGSHTAPSRSLYAQAPLITRPWALLGNHIIVAAHAAGQATPCKEGMFDLLFSIPPPARH